MVGSSPARPWGTSSCPAMEDARALAKVASFANACWYTEIRSAAWASSVNNALANSTAIRGFCITFSIGVIKSCGRKSSILRHRRIDLHGPGVDSACQIRNIAEPVTLEEGGDLHAARA